LNNFLIKNKNQKVNIFGLFLLVYLLYCPALYSHIYYIDLKYVKVTYSKLDC